jgi:hypothetical protein
MSGKLLAPAALDAATAAWTASLGNLNTPQPLILSGVQGVDGAFLPGLV